MTGAELIAAERQRQIGVEGWTPEHDDEHRAGELCIAGACYAEAAHGQINEIGCEFALAQARFWPWDCATWKPSDDPIRNLVKAGALIAAEIDRLQRAEELKP